MLGFVAIRESRIAARPLLGLMMGAAPCDPTVAAGEIPTLCLVAIRDSRIVARPFAAV